MNYLTKVSWTFLNTNRLVWSDISFERGWLCARSWTLFGVIWIPIQERGLHLFFLLVSGQKKVWGPLVELREGPLVLQLKSGEPLLWFCRRFLVIHLNVMFCLGLSWLQLSFRLRRYKLIILLSSAGPVSSGLRNRSYLKAAIQLQTSLKSVHLLIKYIGLVDKGHRVLRTHF